MPDTEADLRARVVGLEQATQTKNQRLATLETWQRQREIESARNDERWVAMESRIDARFSGLEGANKNIQSTLSRINWMIIGGIVVALVGFVFGEVKAAIKGLPQSRKPLLGSVNLRGNIYFQPK